MKPAANALSTRVVVRRAGAGSTPYRWEVYRDETVLPVFVSPDRFSNMDAAYRAGEARLREFCAAAPRIST